MRWVFPVNLQHIHTRNGSFRVSEGVPGPHLHDPGFGRFEGKGESQGYHRDHIHPEYLHRCDGKHEPNDHSGKDQ